MDIYSSGGEFRVAEAKVIFYCLSSRDNYVTDEWPVESKAAADDSKQNSGAARRPT